MNQFRRNAVSDYRRGIRDGLLSREKREISIIQVTLALAANPIKTRPIRPTVRPHDDEIIV